MYPWPAFDDQWPIFWMCASLTPRRASTMAPPDFSRGFLLAQRLPMRVELPPKPGSAFEGSLDKQARADFVEAWECVLRALADAQQVTDEGGGFDGLFRAADSYSVDGEHIGERQIACGSRIVHLASGWLEDVAQRNVHTKQTWWQVLWEAGTIEALGCKAMVREEGMSQNIKREIRDDR
ncbi:hypothetical protein BDV93DRAFT_515403 [Ceratobasidium sp. AG-I]|nr:hypothetical protein BDV93DRAFT_515403 [Ceratobasidium sp. AG-I]